MRPARPHTHCIAPRPGPGGSCPCRVIITTHCRHPMLVSVREEVQNPYLPGLASWALVGGFKEALLELTEMTQHPLQDRGTWQWIHTPTSIVLRFLGSTNVDKNSQNRSRNGQLEATLDIQLYWGELGKEGQQRKTGYPGPVRPAASTHGHPSLGEGLQNTTNFPSSWVFCHREACTWLLLSPVLLHLEERPTIVTEWLRRACPETD